VPPVLRHACDRQIAVGLPRQVIEVGLVVRIQHLPCEALERTRGGYRAVGYRVEQKPGEIGAAVFRENLQRAAFEVLRDDGSGVSASAVEPIELAAVGTELDGPGCHRVLRAGSAKERPFTSDTVLQIFDIAILGVPDREAHTELLIGEMPDEAFVPLQQHAVAGRDIHPVDVEVTFVPRVVPDQQFAGKLRRELLNAACHPWTRGQRPHIASLQINPPGTPIFVSARLAEEYDVPVVVHPDDPRAEIAVGHRRHRARLVEPVDRRDPEIERAARRCTERDPRAVMADPHDASLGICENQASAQ
jgi:hypothetical protein